MKPAEVLTVRFISERSVFELRVFLQLGIGLLNFGQKQVDVKLIYGVLKSLSWLMNTNLGYLKWGCIASRKSICYMI